MSNVNPLILHALKDWIGFNRSLITNIQAFGFVLLLQKTFNKVIFFPMSQNLMEKKEPITLPNCRFNIQILI
jgi:hypothetical protein